jgi:hypothetical protein
MDEELEMRSEEFATSDYVIYVANMRALVARFGARRKLHVAANWQELEQEAAQAIAAQGGGINISGLYQCPRALAERALWST